MPRQEKTNMADARLASGKAKSVRANGAKKPGAAPARTRAVNTEQAKLQLLSEKVRDLRRGAEELEVSSKRLLARLA